MNHIRSTLTSVENDTDERDFDENDVADLEISPISSIGEVSNNASGSKHPPKKRRKSKSTGDELIMSCTDLISSVAKKQNNEQSTDSSKQIEDKDLLFGKTMAAMVKEIPDGMQKEMAKLECQQILIRYRFNPQPQPEHPLPQPSQYSQSQPNQYPRQPYQYSPPQPRQYPHQPMPRTLFSPPMSNNKHQVTHSQSQNHGQNPSHDIFSPPQTPTSPTQTLDLPSSPTYDHFIKL